MKDINFFKPYLGKSKEKINFKIYMYGTIAIVALLIISTLITNTVRIFMLDNSIKDYKNKLGADEIQEKLKEAETVNNEINLLKQYDTSLTGIAVSIKERDNVSYTLLKDITSTLPSQVSFKNIDIVENTISIKGVSSDRTSIAELKHNLSELPLMESVYVNSIDNKNTVDSKNTSNGEYSFDIKCVLKDVE
ncbi:fimbrial protein [Clostridium beijerinckii]|nr:fimbrial protein [Clostridium beijerinckii]